jgi:hypothetical protein
VTRESETAAKRPYTGGVVAATVSRLSRWADDAQKRIERGTIWITLGPVLALGVALRLVTVSGKRSLQGDEAVSYIAATGHQLAYVQAAMTGLSGRWVPARLWKSYLRPDGFWGFTRIRVGLNTTDNHPPLYFWLLHIWVWVFGVHLWSGPTLNSLIAIGTGLALFVLARRLLHSQLQASLVTALWMVSHQVVSVSMWARDYELLALSGVLLALVLHCLIDTSREPTWRDGACVALVVAGALLSHYEAVLFVTVALVAAGLLLVWQHRTRRLWHLLVGAAFGLAGFVALDPGFLASYERQRAQSSALHTAAVEARLGNVISSLASFYWWIRQAPLDATTRAYARGRPEALGMLALVVAALLVLGVAPAWRRRLALWARRRSAGDWLLVAVGLGAAATTLGGYLGMQVPVYAMGTRYLALLWPFLALGSVCLLRLVPRASVPLAAVMVLLIVMPMTVHGFASGARGERALAPPPATQAIVFDNPSRIVLPRALWSVPDDTLVFAGRQSTLLRNPNAWLQRLRPGDLLFTTLRRGGTAAKSREIVALLESRYLITPYQGVNLMRGRGYRVVR